MLSIRKIGVIGRTYRNLNCYSQILGILFKYGFGDLVETLKIDQKKKKYFEMGVNDEQINKIDEIRSNMSEDELFDKMA